VSTAIKKAQEMKEEPPKPNLKILITSNPKYPLAADGNSVYPFAHSV